MKYEAAHQGGTHSVVREDGIVICWISDDVDPDTAELIADALNERVENRRWTP